jgi:outer membrane protein assembly factor BamB
MRFKLRLWFPVLVAIALAPQIHAQRPSADWPQWRGPSRDGTASVAAPATWPQALTQRWKIDVGTGYASPLLIGDRIYLFSRQGEDEIMRAINAADGKLIWQTGYPAPFTMQSSAARHGPGPKSTPVYFNGRLYSIGMTGVVTAFDAATGRQIWQKPGVPDNVPRYTTHSFSPLVDRELVIFHLGGEDNGALTAFDINTGDVKWRWTGDGPGYGSPIVADLAGTRQIVTITQGKIVGLDAATGALLWERPYVISNRTNSITPVLFGQNLIVGGNTFPLSSFTVARRNNQWVTEPLWENAETPIRMSNGVLVGDAFISMSTRNSGQYFAVDARTGKTLWSSEGRQGNHASIARTGNLLLVLEDDGELIVARYDANALETLRRYKVAETETWTAPTVSGNRVFVKDVETLALWTFN